MSARARAWLAAWLLWGVGAGASLAAPPVLLGLDLEVADLTSTSDDAIRLGVTAAVEEINAAGGVLGGRMLELKVTDNRSMPARGVDNLKKLAEMPGMVAVMTGKFSPVALEQVKSLPSLQMILLDPWAAADGIIANGQQPNWAFRLSLSDSIAVNAALRAAKKRGFRKIGMVLPNIAWGRSNQQALEKALNGRTDFQLAATEWYNWGAVGEQSFLEPYRKLRQSGADFIYLVANEREGEQFVRMMAALPDADRLPVLSHWGVTGGDFFNMAGDVLPKVDFSVIQTFSFAESRNARARRLAERAMAHFSVDVPARIPSAVGVAQAYDLVNLLAMAIRKADSADPQEVRAALEKLPAYDGVVKHFRQPFTESRHEALTDSDPYFARYMQGGMLVRDKRY